MLKRAVRAVQVQDVIVLQVRANITNLRGGLNFMTECNCCKSSSIVACNIGNFNSKEKSRYHELRRELTVNLTVEEIQNGYAFIYPNQPSLLLKIAEWISYENRRCPFIKFLLYVSGEADSIRLELTGSDEVKILIKEEFRLA
jgi:hypothetical protein